MSRSSLLGTLTLALALATSAPRPASAAGSVASVRIYALDCGHIHFNDLAVLSDTGEHAGESRELADPCFLIRHPKGDLLWDLGFGDAVAAMPGGKVVPGLATVTVPVTLTSQLAKLGLKPSDIGYVAVSHLHFDHLGNIDAFAQSTLLVNSTDLAWATAAPSVPPEVKQFNAHDPARRITFDGDHDVFGDGTVQILKTPGHTPGHQVLMVKLAKGGVVVLSGDLFHTRENYEKSRVPTINTSRAETLASFDRINHIIRNTHARLVVQHDLGDFKSLPVFPGYLE